MTEEKSNNIFLGILIGVGITFAIMWYMKDNELGYVNNSPTDDQQCTPDYMGGCN